MGDGDRTAASERSRLLATEIESLRTDLELRRPSGLDADAAARLARRLEHVSRGIRERGHVSEEDAAAVRSVAEAVRSALRAPPRPVRSVPEIRRREDG